MEPSDEALCRQVASGDGTAFEELVGRYQQRAYRLAWSVLRDAEEARDLSQEAFIRLHQRAGSFEGRSSFGTWFYRLLVNLCLDHRRKRQWWRRLLVTEDAHGEEGAIIDRQPAPASDPTDEIGRSRTMRTLWEAVGRLSPQQRAVVTLQVQEGLRTAEIAEVLGCSEATVRVHLHRALSTLRKTMAQDG